MIKTKKKKSIRPHLPKNAKENLTKNGKRKPMTLEQAYFLSRKDFQIDNLQRRAFPFYRTNKIGYLLTLTNEITGAYIKINFVTQSGYIKIKSS